MILSLALTALGLFAAPATAHNPIAKPGPDQALISLQEGNRRFVSGKATRAHADAARVALAGKADQGNYAVATVLTCSDSRVPPEILFDQGVMDLFVVRVAGNVCDTDEIGSIEYGLAHVHTPVLVVLGHTQCGAVTAVAQAQRGEGHKLERNIPPLVDNIAPAVKRAVASHPEATGDAIVPYATEENVWQSIEDLFMKSATARALVKDGTVKVVGAVYDVGSGAIRWLPVEKVGQILDRVNASPEKVTEAWAAEAPAH